MYKLKGYFLLLNLIIYMIEFKYIFLIIYIPM
jgi:hypothetical protein